MRSSERMPNFLYIGPDKAGSTWIHRVLSWHPSIFMAQAKELFFFDQYHGRGLDWYRSHFRDATDDHRIVGEVSHDYLFSPQACERIARALPDVRLMVCLREPVERAFSSYLYMVRQGRFNGSFDEAVQQIDELIDHGLYAKHLSPYIEAFGLDRTYVGVFDELEQDPTGFARQLFAYLGIDALALPEELLSKTLAAARPRSMLAAKLSKRAAQAVRQLGSPGLVTRIKSSPVVQRLLYAPYGDGEKPVPSGAARKLLKDAFADDVRRLDECFGLNLQRLWGYRSSS